MKIQIARNGEVIGEFTIMELRLAVKAGTVTEEDFAWAEGWTEWKPVKGLVELATAKGGKPSNEGKAHLAMVERQTQHLGYFTFRIDDVKKELNHATKTIEAYADRKAEIKVELARLKTDLTSATEALAKATDAKQIEQWQEEIENCNEQLQDYEEELEDNIEAEKWEKESLKESLKDYRQEVKDAEKGRIEFWKDTFRENPEDDSAEHDTFYEEYGQFLKMPTNKEVADILATLDAQMPEWEKGRAPSFYSTYQATFPDRVKQRAALKPARQARAKKPSSGCLVLLAIPLLLYVLLRVTIF